MDKGKKIMITFKHKGSQKRKVEEKRSVNHGNFPRNLSQ